MKCYVWIRHSFNKQKRHDVEIWEGWTWFDDEHDGHKG